MQLKNLFWLLLLGLVVQGCDKWDDHTNVNDQNLTTNLLDGIKSHSNIGKFYQYLQKSTFPTILGRGHPIEEVSSKLGLGIRF